MNKSLFTVLIAVIGGIAAITAAVTAFLIFKEMQRRDEEELVHYLDSSIQYFFYNLQKINSRLSAVFFVLLFIFQV